MNQTLFLRFLSRIERSKQAAPLRCIAFRVSAGVLLSCAAALSGCSGGAGDAPDYVPISGTVTYNGQPLTSGRVQYTPVGQGKGHSATGMIDPDGSFEMSSSASIPGVAFGEYMITIHTDGTPTGATPMDSETGGPPPGHPGADSNAAPTIPEKYTVGATSGLTDTVDENHSGTKTIELSD
ncbi:MAG: hypothetical protein DWQ34_17075 [Planctomycetota bacterium]|nr:MAG: hypothetical protein DWQ34_17075 [Planctomycetota bacterium]